MKIDAKITPNKNMRGRITGWIAELGDLVTNGSYPSRAEASAALASLVAARCSDTSAKVVIDAVRGHVCVLTVGLNGYLEQRHVWPDGSVSLTIGGTDTAKELEGFRYHVAQLTWDHASTESDIVPVGMRGEFKWWCEFQWRYRYAIDVLKLIDGTAYNYAQDARNPYKAAIAA